MRTFLIKSLALVACAGAASLGLWLDPLTIAPSNAAPPAARTPLLHGDLPSYPGTFETRIGQDLEINGQRVDMHQFFTEDDPETVADHYEAVLADSVGDAIVRYQLGNADYVGVMNDEGRFLQVMILADGEGSLVIPNVATGLQRPGWEARSLVVPFPPDASNLSTLRSTDGGKVATSAQYISEMDMIGLAEFYRAKLPPLGFAQATGALLPKSLGDNGLLRFTSPEGDVVSIGVHAIAAGQGSLVSVLHEKPINPEDGTP